MQPHHHQEQTHNSETSSSSPGPCNQQHTPHEWIMVLLHRSRSRHHLSRNHASSALYKYNNNNKRNQLIEPVPPYSECTTTLDLRRIKACGGSLRRTHYQHHSQSVERVEHDFDVRDVNARHRRGMNSSRERSSPPLDESARASPGAPSPEAPLLLSESPESSAFSRPKKGHNRPRACPHQSEDIPTHLHLLHVPTEIHVSPVLSEDETSEVSLEDFDLQPAELAAVRDQDGKWMMEHDGSLFGPRESSRVVLPSLERVPGEIGMIQNLYPQTTNEWGIISTPLEDDDEQHECWPSDEERSPWKRPQHIDNDLNNFPRNLPLSLFANHPGEMAFDGLTETDVREQDEDGDHRREVERGDLSFEEFQVQQHLERTGLLVYI